MSRIVRCKTWWDSHDWNYRAAESVQRKPSEGGGEIRVTAPIERGESAQRKPSSAARSCPAEAVGAGSGCAWTIKRLHMPS